MSEGNVGEISIVRLEGIKETCVLRMTIYALKWGHYLADCPAMSFVFVC